MNAAFSPTSLTVIALVLFSVTTMGAGAVPGAEGTASSPSAAPPSSSLDGMTFVAQSGEKGKQASNKDTIVFRNGRFLSEGCNPYGFGNAPYQATVDGATVRFHAETPQPDTRQHGLGRDRQGRHHRSNEHMDRKRWYWNITREYWYKGQLRK